MKIVLDFFPESVIMVDVMNTSDIIPFTILFGFSFFFGFALATCADMAGHYRRGDLDLPLRQE